ncbi:hypothetical protein [Peribacillus phoenicis]
MDVMQSSESIGLPPGAINANSSGGTSYSSVEEWKNLYPFLGFKRI